MSPPSASAQSLDSRNPRRRQRGSEDGLSLRQQPHRKRSKLNRDLYSSSGNDRLANGDGEAKKLTNGHAASQNQGGHSSPLQSLEIPHRGIAKVSSAKGSPRDDGTTTLTKTANYTVKQLPSLPNHIRSRKVGYRGCRILSTGYALTVTRDQALIWDYTTSASVPTTRALSLPHPAKADDPIPLGAFVTYGSGSELGLVVVNATSGKVSFWESVENADALSLFEQRRNGVEGSCGSLMYGETITDIDDAGSAGFILSFSTGRTAQLLVRDAQSRPFISANFLRNNNAGSGGGFFGGLRNVFGGGGWLRTLAAVKTRPASARGQTEAIIASEEGTIQFWQLSWSGQTILQREINVRSAIEDAISGMTSADVQSQSQGVKVEDFVIASGAAEYFNMLLLVSFGAGGSQSFALVRIEIEDDDIPAARRMVVLSSYSPLLVPKSNWKPKLCLPSTGSTAFIVFEKAIVLVSLELGASNADSQFLLDAGQLPEPFQDTVSFRDERDYFSCGAMIESDGERSREPSIIVFVQNFGIIRVRAASASPDAQKKERTVTTVQSKIEQAVFFGSRASNPLDLAPRSPSKFPIEEVESAALKISEAVLATASPYLTAVAPSMEFHLEQRAGFLKDLASHLRLFYRDISRETKWQMLWDAEKMAAARNVWALCDGRRSKAHRDLRLLPEMIVSINEGHRTAMDSDRGENDSMRQFFLRDIANMHILLSWPYKQLELLREHGYIRDFDQLIDLMSEANDIVIGGLTAAFDYRSANLELHGLEQEPVMEGLLYGNYEGLPRFWTSSITIWLKFPEHVEAIRAAILEEADSELIMYLPNAPPDIRKITLDMVAIIDLYCTTCEESCRWYLSRDDEKERQKGNSYLGKYQHHRQEMITALPDTFIDLADSAMSLAEKYLDMQALVRVTSTTFESLKQIKMQATPDEAEKANAEVREMEKKHRALLKKHGNAFADVMYSAQIEGGNLDTFLDQAISYPKEVTTYLRSNPRTKKLGWINEAIFEKNHFLAGRDLMDVAVSQETELWSKKVELSISKLALIATEVDDKDDQELMATEAALQDAVQLVKIQEKIYEHVNPELYDAVDGIAALELAMAAFGVKTVRDAPKLQQLLERGMEKLVNRAAMGADQLIDVLTLMDQSPCKVKADDICGQESLLALKVLKHAGLSKDADRFEPTLRIIWRRCFLKDNWTLINDTERKSDQDAMEDLESTTLFKTIYEGFAQGVWEEKSGVRILGPEDVLGAGTTRDDHSARFSSPDLSEPIAKEMEADDNTLQELVKGYRLEHWFTATKELAERRWRAEGETRESLAQKLGSTTEAIYDEDADLKRGGEKSGINIPRNWREAVRMGLGMFR